MFQFRDSPNARQLACWRFMIDFQRKNGFPPSVSEVAAKLKSPQSSASKTMSALVNKGLATTTSLAETKLPRRYQAIDNGEPAA